MSGGGAWVLVIPECCEKRRESENTLHVSMGVGT